MHQRQKSPRKSYPAQIVFVQGSRKDNVWVGHLLNKNAVDMTYGFPSALVCRITESSDGSCSLMTQGSQVGSRRYSGHPNLTAAQEAAMRWCGRRWRVFAD